MTQAGAPSPTRRDRMRAATMKEITATARRLLVAHGPDAASLRAIAREMGMTAPALYRYYGSREDLLRHVIASIFKELSHDVRHAIDAAGNDADGVRGKMTAKMVAACLEFRRWALGHREEFALLFGVPLPGTEIEDFDVAQQCALEFAGTFYVLFIELWTKTRFPVPDEADIDQSLLPQLDRFRKKLGTNAPPGAILIFLRCWVLLYGAVSMEVFGHLGFAMDNPAALFELTLADLARLVGLEYPVRDA